MEFFTNLHKILKAKEPSEKIELFEEFYKNYKDNKLEFDRSLTAEIFETPSYESICKIVPATTLSKRASLSTKKGKARLIHSIVHIEYSAIDLALDHAYRFSDMPKSYYDDWLEVAEDEIRHFLMLEKILKNLGYSYGDFPVHSFLFDVSQKSLDLLTRMATIPRYLEASGLDSNPLVIEKLKRIDDEDSKEIIKALEIILEEEIDHVKKGNRWFLWACNKHKVDKSDYFDIVQRVLPGAKKKKSYVNIKSRKRAGFSCEEIEIISTKPCPD